MAVFIRAFRHVATAMKLPRVVITPQLMGRTVGPPGKRDRHREVVEACLALLETASPPGTILDLAS